ncbi:MAG: hypothetical protein HOM11_05350 [Methylococcales bacterium]|jgi:hypothetical protein|nr:hypothetical protein [Methylococcales bacterium]MBT7444409.1 hypothetical protein [Methylococcales bacterium]
MRQIARLVFLFSCIYSPLSSSFGVAATYAGNEQGQHKLYFFDGREVQRWQANATHMDKNYPQKIEHHLKGTPNHIDAAVYTGINNPTRPNKILFFKGQLYWQWDIASKKMDLEYPKLISMDWKGLPDRLDAAAYAPYEHSQRSNKMYFFKSNQYWRWDIAKQKMDDGYPKRIGQGWNGLPSSSLDMAVYSGLDNAETAHKLYLFQGNRYWRWDLNTDLLDTGYPKPVNDNWPDLRY